MEAEKDYVWYFAYGSNINETIFCGARKIQPHGKKLGILPGWRLIFNLRAFPLVEPSMANIQPIREDCLMTPDHPRCVHGVAYKISLDQLDYMYKTEGDGRVGGYHLIKVNIKTYDNEDLEVYTLSIPIGMTSKRDYAPSKRYYNLIVQGCEKEGIDKAYTEWVRKHPFFDAEAFQRDHPYWAMYAKIQRFSMLPFMYLVFRPSLFYFPHVPYTTRTMRRILFFGWDLLSYVGKESFHLLNDIIIGTFGPQELKELFVSSHQKMPWFYKTKQN